MRLQGKVAIVTGGASGFGAGSMTCQGNGLRAQMPGDNGRHSIQGSQGPFCPAT